MIWWTGLAPWEFEFPIPLSLISSFLGWGSAAGYGGAILANEGLSDTENGSSQGHNLAMNVLYVPELDSGRGTNRLWRTVDGGWGSAASPRASRRVPRRNLEFGLRVGVRVRV
jgi:hypothetical protein